MKKNNHKLRIPRIEFDMPITDLVLDLERLRDKKITEKTKPYIFNELKKIFHMLESIGSSRIEGNNTTIANYIESTELSQSKDSSSNESISEILNIEYAMRYIENNINEIPISLKFIRDLHSLAVNDLNVNREGALHPGAFRTYNVEIKNSEHIPPDSCEVEFLLLELVDFIKKEDPPKYQLLKIAIAHHRFVWIHPFENGNGRVVRLFTYALLLKYVIKSNERIINPAAVFCSNRNNYYRYLSLADKGTDEGLIAWCEYVLKGLKKEFQKIDKLLDYNFLRNKILLPTVSDALKQKYITPEEFIILIKTISLDTQILQASDLKELFKDKRSSDISRMIKGLRDKNMLKPLKEGARKYTLSFSKNHLLRSIIIILSKEGFLPENETL